MKYAFLANYPLNQKWFKGKTKLYERLVYFRINLLPTKYTFLILFYDRYVILEYAKDILNSDSSRQIILIFKEIMGIDFVD